jgi:hypothetical protein
VRYKIFIIFKLRILVRNCQILSVFQKSFTSNSSRIQSCPDPECFSRIRIQIQILLKVSNPTGSGSTKLVTRYVAVCDSVEVLDIKDFDSGPDSKLSSWL